MQPPRALTAALLLPLAVLVLSACGGDDAPEAPSLEQWQAKANQFCSDGVQEAIALPLPGTAGEVGPDAAAMADVVLTVLDGISPLVPPDDDETRERIKRYLGELTADAGILGEVSKTATAGEDYLVPLAQLDESAGQVALELDLEQCAPFANAVARTP